TTDMQSCSHSSSFFSNDPSTTAIYTLSLHDALPISSRRRRHGDGDEERDSLLAQQARRLHPGARGVPGRRQPPGPLSATAFPARDRKSTRLNSSHVKISYAVFCLKKKKKEEYDHHLE